MLGVFDYTLSEFIRFKRLYEMGIITKEEWETYKAKLKNSLLTK